MQIRKRYYTPHEARAALPDVRTCLSRMQEAAKELRLLRRSSRAGGSAPPDTTEDARRDRERARELEAELQGLLDSLDEREIEVKDLELGLIDFPALLRGREVCLCYRADESSLEHWHGIRDGFAGRRPVSEVNDGDWEWCN